MSKALFISDLHIKSPDDPRAELFRRFLRFCAAHPPAHLFLVGDIFDLWIADRDYFVKAYQPIIDDLTALKRLGTQIHYFEGNHDLDLKLYWQHKLGFDVQTEAAFYDLDGQTVRVEHGDQMDPDDNGYLFLRWLLRTPLVRLLGRCLPNSWVGWIGRRASRASRDYTSNVKTASEEQSRLMIRAHAGRAYLEKPFDLFLSGHVHVSCDFQENRYRVINTGTWLIKPLVFVLEDKLGYLADVEDFLRQ